MFILATRETLRRKLFSTMIRHSEKWLPCDSRFLKNYPAFVSQRNGLVRAELFPLKFGVFMWSQVTPFPKLVGEVLEDYGPKQYLRMSRAVTYLIKRIAPGADQGVKLCLSDVMPYSMVKSLEMNHAVNEFVFSSSNVVLYSEETRRHMEDMEQAETLRKNVRVIRV